ncbi:hypothetical protein BDV37DRAFT_265440 [Aspergillus pseudonomiae]|uniref:Uncharacterized protein n=1 Tax=Aspergillus pseudonomiae TaxID=1506151 RepID=A0A5N7CV27_9EURO|nr:uncharacterized protein BDV37DRAFT_265440 [Aspergillus pseudonomiae]KAE8397577.1 hypothetical protein BDV37DRAFT_265440 [Aspergillus pseudonomiae]
MTPSLAFASSPLLVNTRVLSATYVREYLLSSLLFLLFIHIYIYIYISLVEGVDALFYPGLCFCILTPTINHHSRHISLLYRLVLSLLPPLPLVLWTVYAHRCRFLYPINSHH